MNKPLAAIIGTALFSTSVLAAQQPVEFYDLENLGRVNISKKTLTIQFEAKAPTIQKHKEEIQEYVKDFFNEYKIKVQFAEVTPNYNSIKLLGLITEEYESYRKEHDLVTTTNKLYRRSYEDNLGVAYVQDRIALFREEKPRCLRKETPCTPPFDSYKNFYGQTAVHEILHTLLLLHVPDQALTNIPHCRESRAGLECNILMKEEFETNPFLSKIQERQLHSLLSKGHMYTIFEEAIQQPSPLSWYAEQKDKAKEILEIDESTIMP